MDDACAEISPVMYASFWWVRRMSGEVAHGYSIRAGAAGEVAEEGDSAIADDDNKEPAAGWRVY